MQTPFVLLFAALLFMGYIVGQLDAKASCVPEVVECTTDAECGCTDDCLEPAEELAICPPPADIPELCDG
jgi:hypothetical protein